MSRTPVADHALLSDCHPAALVSRAGSMIRSLRRLASPAPALTAARFPDESQPPRALCSTAALCIEVCRHGDVRGTLAVLSAVRRGQCAPAVHARGGTTAFLH